MNEPLTSKEMANSPPKLDEYLTDWSKRGYEPHIATMLAKADWSEDMIAWQEDQIKRLQAELAKVSSEYTTYWEWAQEQIEKRAPDEPACAPTALELAAWRVRNEAKAALGDYSLGDHVAVHREILGDLCAALDARQPSPPSDAARDVLTERERQKNVEGWTPDHDDEHDEGQMAGAAASYAMHAADVICPASQGDGGWDESPPEFWPWDVKWWKPTGSGTNQAGARRDLVKAGALILAEIERIDRAAVTKVDAPTDPDEETPCPKRDDGLHCECWYGGNTCCSCGDGDRKLGEFGPTCAEVRAAAEKTAECDCPPATRCDDCPRLAAETSAIPEAPEAMWECSVCSFFNFSTETYCRKCDYSRYVMQSGKPVPRDGKR